jgi:hypothetical protein
MMIVLGPSPELSPCGDVISGLATFVAPFQWAARSTAAASLAMGGPSSPRGLVLRGRCASEKRSRTRKRRIGVPCIEGVDASRAPPPFASTSEGPALRACIW